VLSLVLGALFFAGIHLGIAGTVMRDRAIGILGENGYRGAFAVASVVGLGWLVAAYNRAPYLGTWGMLEWWKPRRAAAAGDRPDHAPPVPDGGRPLGAGTSDWQRRCGVPGLFRDLGDRGSRRHRIDRCKASTALGKQLGAICSTDLDCSVRSHRRGAESIHPSRDRALALGDSAPSLCADARWTRAGHRRLTIPCVDPVTFPAC